jgi:hypothetical protein
MQSCGRAVARSHTRTHAHTHAQCQLFFVFFKVWDSGVPLFHQFNSLLTITIFPNIVITLLLQRITCYNHFSQSFCLLSVFLVRCLIGRGFCWRRLMLSVLFRLTASSRPGFPYSPFSSNALSSGAIADPSPACVLVPPFLASSHPNF